MRANPYREPWFFAEYVREDLQDLGRGLIWLTFLAVALLLTYPLSAGPALWLAGQSGPVGAWIYFMIYEPLIAYGYDHPAFNDAMNWYLSWWGEPVNLLECP